MRTPYQIDRRILWGLILPLILMLPSTRGLMMVMALWPVGLIAVWCARQQFASRTAKHADQFRLAAFVGGHFALFGAAIYLTGVGVSRIMLWFAAQKIAGIVTAAVIATMSVALSGPLAAVLLDQRAAAESVVWTESNLEP